MFFFDETMGMFEGVYNCTECDNKWEIYWVNKETTQDKLPSICWKCESDKICYPKPTVFKSQTDLPLIDMLIK